MSDSEGVAPTPSPARVRAEALEQPTTSWRSGNRGRARPGSPEESGPSARPQPPADHRPSPGRGCRPRPTGPSGGDRKGGIRPRRCGGHTGRGCAAPVGRHWPDGPTRPPRPSRPDSRRPPRPRRPTRLRSAQLRGATPDPRCRDSSSRGREADSEPGASVASESSPIGPYERYADRSTHIAAQSVSRRRGRQAGLHSDRHTRLEEDTGP